MVGKKDRVESLIEQEKWSAARRAIEEELRDHPDDHWLLTRLSTTYYEEGDYEAALRWAEKAKEIAPDCPLVLWDYAGALDMLGRERDALKVYRSLVERGVDAVAEDGCGEGVEWAKGLLADCVFRAGCCLEDLGDNRGASRLYRTYLALVDLGVESIYPRAEAVTRLRAVAEVEDLLREAAEEMGGARTGASRVRHDEGGDANPRTLPLPEHAAPRMAPTRGAAARSAAQRVDARGAAAGSAASLAAKKKGGRARGKARKT
jgi:hypothetical protein